MAAKLSYSGDGWRRSVGTAAVAATTPFYVWYDQNCGFTPREYAIIQALGRDA
jgi:hypothetical protein